jgi:predicted dehydrogenase
MNYHFYGRKGYVVLKNIGRDIKIYGAQDSPEHQGFTELTDEPIERRGGSPRDQFRFLADNVIDSLEGRAASLSTGEDSLKALQILLALEKSANSDGKKIEVP